MVAVDICNLALSYLGDTATVASIDPPEGSAQAQHCARFYPMAVQLLLEMHQWNFTTRRVALALLNVTAPAGWQFAYAYPSDVCDIISVWPACLYESLYPLWSQNDDPFVGRMVPFEREAGSYEVEIVGTQTVILSNAESAVARYTTTKVQPGQFPAMFADALAWKLAAMLAGPLLKGDAGAAESKRCEQAFQLKIMQAMSKDANRRQSDPRPLPSALQARL